MKHIAKIYIVALCALALWGCRGGDDVLEPSTPIITGQSVISGDYNVKTDIPYIKIIFDRAIEMGDPAALSLLPERAMEPMVEGSSLILELPEGLEYETDYILTIGAGAVKDQLSGGINLERIITFVTEKAPYVPPTEPTLNLVDSNATLKTKELYGYLWSVYGQYSLSGATANIEWKLYDSDWIEKWCGVAPAVAVFNYQYLHRSPSQMLDYSNTTPICEWWSRGGIVAIDWHWMVPAAEGSHQYSCNSEDTSLTVTNMLTEGTWQNDIMKADLEEIADMLLLLQEEGVAVLWRPLPEGAGNTYAQSGGKAWYWWGSDGAEAYKELWRTMYDYFQERGVHNLVWVWTTQTYDIDYYPGEEYVDMISYDMYNRASARTIAGLWSHINSYFPHKMVALSEFGSVIEMPNHLDKGAMWSYFASAVDSYNDFSEGYAHSHANIAWWTTTFEDPRVISLNELPRYTGR